VPAAAGIDGIKPANRRRIVAEDAAFRLQLTAYLTFRRADGEGPNLRTAVVPWAVLAACHVKPTLNIRARIRDETRVRRKKSSRRR
jgi:hypothetical protein